VNEIKTTERKMFFETEVANTYVSEENIFVTEFKDNAHIKPENIKEIISRFNFVRGSGNYLVLNIAGAHTHATSEAREYAQNHASIAIAEAFFVHSLSQRLLISLYMKIRKNQHPTAVFGNKEEAIKWLTSFN
jgi:hypothetical protein